MILGQMQYVHEHPYREVRRFHQAKVLMNNSEVECLAHLFSKAKDRCRQMYSPRVQVLSERKLYY